MTGIYTRRLWGDWGFCTMIGYVFVACWAEKFDKLASPHVREYSSVKNLPTMIAVLFVSVSIAVASAVPASLADTPPQNGPKACPSTTPGPGEYTCFSICFLSLFLPSFSI